MSKNIVRVQKDKSNPYVMINKLFLENPDMSWKAKGLLTYLLSKPDNWVVILEHLYKQSPDGEKSVRSGFNELKNHNHLMRFPVYKGNKIVHWETVIFETPFTEDERIRSRKILDNIEETSVLAENGKVLEPVLAGFVQVQNVNVQKEVLLSNDILLNKDFTNQSTNQEAEVERLDNILNSIDDDHLKNNGVEPQFIQAMKNVITDMFFTKLLKINDSSIPKTIVQRQLAQIDAEKLEAVYEDYKETSKIQPITNPKGYLTSMIYNSLSNDHLAMTSRVNYAIYGGGKKKA